MDTSANTNSLTPGTRKEPIPVTGFFYETVFIQVSDDLYSIPKQIVNIPDTIFAQMFEDGRPSDSVYGPEGSHRRNPIILEGINPKAFLAFMKAVWKREEIASIKPEEWTDILRLATMWNFGPIIKESQEKVSNAHSKSAFNMLKLGNEFKVKDWVIRGYSSIADPSSMFTIAPLIKNGYSDKISEIIRIREALRFYSQQNLYDLDLNGAKIQLTFQCASKRSASIALLNDVTPKDPIPVAEFFYETVFIQVSSDLYSIPKEFINIPGTVFAQMFADGTPAKSRYGPEGSHQRNPIILEGIERKAFRGFVKAIWKRDQIASLSSEEWVKILRSANLWNLETIIKEAKGKVFDAHHKSALDMLKLGNEFKFEDWVIRGYSILVDPSIMFHAKQLVDNGHGDKIIAIVQIREALRYFAQKDPHYVSKNPAYSQKFECPSCLSIPPRCDYQSYGYSHSSYCNKQDFVTSYDMSKMLIQRVFKDELERLV
ncbi:hypothetical protein CVT24_011663 [Panaeolus cyanescens]|uniref:BTB domain-containing protein n=1 Tax=Panaeolus cyanescens TaxID=181874 RepID=A0A409YH34_9AGAR|nr:hypothetical protein CVT24_011663 [Panaeolus cyanescens]